MSIAAGIAATKATLDLTKIISDLVKRPNIDAADVQAKLHEMLIHAVNAQTALGEAQQEITELRRQLDDQEASRATQADLEMDPLCRYYVRKSERERGLIPYCPTCWRTERKLVPLTLLQHPGSFMCAIHKVKFASPEHLEQQKQLNANAAEASRARTVRTSWMG